VSEELWILAYLMVGFISGILDYSAGIGFGLIASLFLVGLLDIDPRIVASAASLAQVFNAIPAVLNHYRLGNIRVDRRYLRVAIALAVSSSLGSIISITLYRSVKTETALSIFAVITIIILVIAWFSHLYKPSGGYGQGIVWIGGFIAGIEKAVSGGGFSMILVFLQKIVGVDLRSAIAGLPVIKLIPFIIVSLGYILSGFFSLYIFVSLLVGGFLSAMLSPIILRRIGEDLSLYIITVFIIIVLVNLIIF